MRFLVMGHCLFRGTRHEETCSFQRHRAGVCIPRGVITSLFVAWWLRRTSLTERQRFFRNPDLRSLLRHIRTRASRQQNAWLFGHHGVIQALMRIHQAARSLCPIVLRPCTNQNAEHCTLAPEDRGQ